MTDPLVSRLTFAGVTAFAGAWLIITGTHHTAVIATPATPASRPAPVRIPAVIGAVGLTPHAAALARYIQITYPDVSYIGGVRTDPLPDHPSGRAIDIMVGSNTMLGNAIEADLMAHASQFSIRYLIWQETYRNPSGAAQFMADRGSPTANHYDHVHVTVNG